MSKVRFNGKKRLGLWLFNIVLISLFSIIGCSMKDNARNFKTDGLVNFVCHGKAPDVSQSNVCGERSVWLEADSGVIAYVTVYGISNLDEAKSIFNFIKKLKGKNKQNIPVQVAIYSSSRSVGREPSAYKIFEDNI